MNDSTIWNDAAEDSYSRWIRRIGAAVTASVLVLVGAGCDGLFEVENPTNITDDELSDPALADALGNAPEGAVANYGNDEFASAGYSWATVWTAVVADEGFVSGSGTFRIQIDDGFMESYNQHYDGLYNGFAAARWIADDATGRLQELLENPESDVRVAQGHYWGGIARLTMADLFEGVVYDNNPPIGPREATEDAISKFEQAVQVAEAAGDANLVAAAHGSIARAYRSLYYEELHHGDGEDLSLFEQAAQHAQQALDIKSDFVEYVNYAPPGSENEVFDSMTQSRYNRMDPSFGFLTDPVSGEVDPRIQHSDLANISPRTGDSVYIQQKYRSESADIPVSRADEARLIIAEYATLAGELDSAVEMINEVRTAAGLPEFQSDDQDEIMSQLRYERKVEFWLEMRRWQDMRYYEIVPERWADANKQRGIHRRWPVSQRERDNNPAY